MKLIVPAVKTETAELELYDVNSDPLETKNLASEKADTNVALMKKLDEWWKP